MPVSVVAWFLCTRSKKLVFVHIASAMTAVHRDCQVLAANTRRPEIQPLVSQDQVVSADLRQRMMDKRNNDTLYMQLRTPKYLWGLNVTTQKGAGFSPLT